MGIFRHNMNKKNMNRRKVNEVDDIIYVNSVNVEKVFIFFIFFLTNMLAPVQGDKSTTSQKFTRSERT